MYGSDDHLTRQADLIPFEVLSTPITIIGAGAIGSWVTLSLAKMGFNHLVVFDGDEVTVENMNCQFFPYKAIGHNKVEYLRRLVSGFANVNIVGMNTHFDPALHNLTGKIVISSVDSMEARKMIWAQAKHASVDYFIDPRMGAESSLLYVMQPTSTKDRTSYEKTLYSDDNAVQERCTAKATIYTANLLAGQVCKAVKDIVVEKPYTRISQWNIAENACMMYKSEGKSGS